jgi:molecular chaperone HscB
LNEYRAADRASERESTLCAKLKLERDMLEQRQRDMEAALQQLFVEWDVLQDRGEATSQARTERDRILKQMRENLSNRTYVKNIVSDLVSTIG